MSTLSDSAIHALAGSVGGCLSMAATYPLTNLSMRAAVQTKKENLTLVQAVTKTLRDEGISGLYSGLESSLFGIAVTNGVYYAFYEEVRSLLMRRRAKTSNSPAALSTLEGIIAGLIAGSITTLATNPIWTVQAHQSTRAVTVTDNDSLDGSELSTAKKIKPSAMSSFHTILKEDGVAGFWRGIGPALILVVNPVVQYTAFERMVSMLVSFRLSRAGSTPTGKRAGTGRSSLSDWDFFVLGAASKLLATGGTYPILVIKSRLQAATHKYKSTLKAIMHVMQTEGIAGLYAGLGPKLLQSALTAAFLFVAQRRIYDAVKSAILIAAERKGVAARA